MIALAQKIDWETATGVIKGDRMLDLLVTAPAIGQLTAIIWLAYIATPRRFINAKAIGAYCGFDPSLRISAGKVTGTTIRGGCKQIHHALCTCASILIKNHNEMFGQWGYNIYMRTKKWKKATNAVARKLAVSLYYMNMRGVIFSYDKYRLLSQTDVIDITIEQLTILNHNFRRYLRILVPSGITTTRELVGKYFDCSLNNIAGLGTVFFKLVKEFIDNQKQYRDLLQKYNANLEEVNI